ncbi:glycosyltransferase family 2 protein [Ligilactobacillus salivarius]|uniref:Glycosyltransferase family 2 protein n=1 Tax=Ligilactobacillus salivarius TaxID=1624 RepID=A0ABD7YWV7_9LACO|nr:glycosyltransferase family 2 protein [Ligilactobacillus salivarius]WHS05699.1 glycosyltransferase family 2 protein [Ligilactobacillus salivarius]WHS08224.1 glycosyltransferase family 2 protein [Ligilactobacillus salivarius]WHS09610.1 glycosyltransferase family 2 protein [Ligilactobacillus salivarius]WHS13550.1 glycosyltransferase family 2 protein [Ligilactobacillus salivarius]WHS17833.1 glycosyltransferase family 2 protein [Ligilactobacillus salivarius]
MKEKNVEVSVIIPVYNVRKYLRRCIESVLDQNFDNYEIILVDDGSTDGSEELCDLYKSKHDRVRVYHKENGGLSDARNYGIDKSKGRYLAFIDSDDYIAYDYLSTLYTMIVKNKVKISCVSSHKVKTDKLVFSKEDDTDEVDVLSNINTLKRVFKRDDVSVSAWGKMYDRELFNEIRYPKGKLYEDLYTTPYLIEKSEKVALSRSKKYYYYVRKDSITKRTISNKDYSIFEALQNLVDYFGNKYQELYEPAIACYILYTINNIINRLVFVDNGLPTIKKIMKKKKKYWFIALTRRYLPIRLRIQILVLKLSPQLYRNILKVVI